MTNKTEITRKDKERARVAYKYAKEGTDIKIAKEKYNYDNCYYIGSKYSSYVSSTINQLKTNGLAPTIAFIYSRREGVKDTDGKKEIPGSSKNPKNSYDLLYNQLNDWIINQCQLINSEYSGLLVKAVTELDSEKYKRITLELFAMLSWVKRFSEGLSIEKEIEEAKVKQEEVNNNE